MKNLETLLKPSWYREQMSNWSFKSYMLLMIGYGIILGSTAAGKISGIAIWTMLAGMLGFTCTVAITNARPLNGILGLVSALIYIFVAAQAKNFADVVLQAAYIVLLDIPVLISPNWAKNAAEHIHGLTFLKWIYTMIFFVIVLGLLFLMDSGKTFIPVMSPRPFIDALSGAIGITGAVLCTFRFREQYYFWTLQGVMSIVLWAITFGQGDASIVLLLTYIMYFMNDMVAFFDRKTSWFHKNNIEAVTE